MKKSSSSPQAGIESEFQIYKERFEQAQKAGNVGVFDIDLVTGKQWWSAVEEELFGLLPGTFSGTDRDWRDRVHPADLPRVTKELKERLKNKLEDYESEFRIVLPDGNIRTLRGKGNIYYDAKGKPLRLIGVNYDFTERMQLEESLRFKAEASKVLASSLDYQTTLNSVARLAVPHVADWCVVDLLDSNGALQMVAISHSDPNQVKWARERRRSNPPDMKATSGLTNVLRTGKPEFHPVITNDMIEKAAKSPEELQLLRKIGFSSVIIVPLKAHDKTIGAMTFVMAESKRHYSKLDFQLTEQIASRASLAIENAQLYAEVDEERERLNNIVANVPGVVWEAYGKPDAAKQRIDFINKYVEKMLGYTVDEWLNTPNFWLTIVHPADREKAAAQAVAKFESGEGGVSRFRWLKKNGESIWVETHSYPILDKQGKAIGMRGVTMDVSERMELERRKDEFISMASHELKTPLTSIKVFTQILQRTLKEDSNTLVTKSLDRINVQVGKLTTLVSDLLDVSKIQSGKLELRKANFMLNTLIQDCVDSLQETTDHKIIIKGETSYQIYGDEDRLGQVLINFLTNAIKYSPEAGKITVAVTKETERVIIGVKDNGIGISKEHHNRIFDRFYRIYDNEDKTYPGLGMGLYISSQIIKRHEGQIWLKSTKGKGTTFYFSLPIIS